MSQHERQGLPETITPIEAWEGIITEVGEAHFIGQLSDTNRELPDHDEEFPFTMVFEGWHPLVRKGLGFTLEMDQIDLPDGRREYRHTFTLVEDSPPTQEDEQRGEELIKKTKEIFGE